jgi:hypothetical protein
VKEHDADHEALIEAVQNGDEVAFVNRLLARDTLRARVAAVERIVRDPQADTYRDEATRHAVAQPYADNRYVRLLDDVRAVLDAERR